MCFQVRQKMTHKVHSICSLNTRVWQKNTCFQVRQKWNFKNKFEKDFLLTGGFLGQKCRVETNGRWWLARYPRHWLSHRFHVLQVECPDLVIFVIRFNKLSQNLMTTSDHSDFRYNSILPSPIYGFERNENGKGILILGFKIEISLTNLSMIQDSEFNASKNGRRWKKPWKCGERTNPESFSQHYHERRILHNKLLNFAWQLTN